jgi:tetratricopeptide (TPR) repeat protein
MSEKLAMEKNQKKQEKKFIARIDPDIDLAVDEAMELAEKGEFKKAEDILDALLSENPDLYIVHFGIGTLFAMKGNYQEAISHFDQCLDIFPYFAEAWFNKGMAHKSVLDVKNMIISLRKVIVYGNPEDDFVITAEDILSDLANLTYSSSGLTLDQYIQSSEEFDNAFAALKNSQYEKALSGFKRVLKLNPNHQQSHGNIGLCYAFLGRKAEAIAAFDEALKIDPEYELVKANRATVLLQAEGETLPDDAPMLSIDYYKDKFVNAQMD